VDIPCHQWPPGLSFGATSDPAVQQRCLPSIPAPPAPSLPSAPPTRLHWVGSLAASPPPLPPSYPPPVYYLLWHYTPLAISCTCSSRLTNLSSLDHSIVQCSITPTLFGFFYESTDFFGSGCPSLCLVLLQVKSLSGGYM
jgi:hypothetical protein